MSRSVNLQRRHFEFIADTIVSLKAHMPDDAHNNLAIRFADRLSYTNANFNWGRFYDRSRGVVKAKPVRVRKARVTASVASEDATNYWE